MPKYAITPVLYNMEDKAQEATLHRRRW